MKSIKFVNMSDEVKRVVMDIEHYHFVQDTAFETMTIIDPTSGEIVYNLTSGDKDKIDATYQEMTVLEGNICTHNHPESEIAALSPADVITAFMFGSVQMRAVCNKTGHRAALIISPDLPNKLRRNLIEAAEDVNDHVYTTIANETLSAEDAAELLNGMWTGLFENNPYVYYYIMTREDMFQYINKRIRRENAFRRQARGF